MGSRPTNVLASLPLLAAALLVGGCGSDRALPAPTAANAAVAQEAPRAPAAVEVWMSSELHGALAAAGRHEARRDEPAARVAAMHARAASQGLDGLRWVDCSRGARICTAKGFLYDKETPSMPEIGAHAAPAGDELARPVEPGSVASEP